MAGFNLYKPPSSNAIFMAIGISLFTAGVLHGTLISRGTKPHTMSQDWVEANKEYMKFQKMNPIFGISRGL